MIDIKDYVKRVYESWKSYSKGLGYPSTEERRLIQRRAKKAEKNLLRKLNTENDDWQFQLTPYSRTPADIIGIVENTKSVYVVLIQVKSGKLKTLNKRNEVVDINDFYNVVFNELKELKRQVYISFCYSLIPNNEIGFKSPIIYSIDNINSLRGKGDKLESIDNLPKKISELFENFIPFTNLEEDIKNRNYRKTGKSPTYTSY